MLLVSGHLALFIPGMNGLWGRQWNVCRPGWAHNDSPSNNNVQVHVNQLDTVSVYVESEQVVVLLDHIIKVHRKKSRGLGAYSYCPSPRITITPKC